MGQGCDTVLSQMTAECLGITVEQVRLVRPDTDATPFDMGTASSRSTFHMGNAIQRATAEIRGELFAAASELLEAPPDQLDLADEMLSIVGPGASAFISLYAPIPRIGSIAEACVSYQPCSPR